MNISIPKRSTIFTGINYSAFVAAVVGENYGYHSSQHFVWLIPAFVAFLYLLYVEAKSLSHLGYEHTLRGCLKFSAWSGFAFPIPLFILLILMPLYLKGITITQAVTFLISSFFGMLLFTGAASLICVVLLNQFFGVISHKK